MFSWLVRRDLILAWRRRADVLATLFFFVIVAPLLGVQFGLSQNTLATITVSLLLGTPILSLVGSVGAALTLGLRAANVLIALLVLPLCIPALIFGAGAVDASVNGTGSQP